jgi:hypothetical protein
LGIGDWGLGIGPNPQSPIPNPQSPIPNDSNIKKYNQKFYLNNFLKINSTKNIILLINKLFNNHKIPLVL